MDEEKHRSAAKAMRNEAVKNAWAEVDAAMVENLGRPYEWSAAERELLTLGISAGFSGTVKMLTDNGFI